MKVLFVSSGNRPSGISEIILQQGRSLKKCGIDIDYFLIIGKGIKGYLSSIKSLKAKLVNNYDLVHAHYSYSGFSAAIAGAQPLVVSLMGSDVKKCGWGKILIYFFNFFYWDKIIVKSCAMSLKLNLKNMEVIPNGVDLQIFYPYEKSLSRDKLNWDQNKIHLLFLSDPLRPEKNYRLFNDALQVLPDKSIEIHHLVNIKSEIVPDFLNAADVAILTSLREGSPNVIKEAMACNVPIVSTDIGDVRWILGDTAGCFLTSFETDDVAFKIEEAIFYSRKQPKTKGRDRIIKLGLNSDNIAERIKSVYKTYAGKS